VLNKTDLLAPETVAKIVDRWERFLGTKAVAVSAVTRDGLPVLRKESLSLSKGGGETVEPAFSLNTRQESLLNETLRSLQGAIQSPLPETLSTDLRRALDLLNLITGQGASHEILDVIFSRFCIGK